MKAEQTKAANAVPTTTTRSSCLAEKMAGASRERWRDRTKEAAVVDRVMGELVAASSSGLGPSAGRGEQSALSKTSFPWLERDEAFLWAASNPVSTKVG